MAGFNPDQYLAEKSVAPESSAPASGFNPDSYLSEKTGAAPDKPGDAGGAAIEGFGQGATLGYLPQLQALASKPIYAGLNAVTGQNVQPDSYVDERDASIARQDALKKSNPYAYYGSMAAGAVAMSPALEAATASIAPKAVMASRIGKAAAMGATAGAAANPGDTKGEISPLQPVDRAKNAAVGAATGVVFDKAVQGLGKLASALGASGEGLETLAEKNAVRSAGAQKPQMKQLINQNKVKDVGRFIIDENIVPTGASAEDVAANAQRVKSEAGQAIGDVFDKMESSGKGGTFDRKALAQAMRDALAGDDSVTGSLHSKKVMPQLEDLIADFESKPGAASARELLKLKGSYDAEINYAKKAMDLPALQAGYKNIRSTISEAINDRAQALSNEVRGNLGKTLSAANKRYGLASTVSDIAQNKLAQEGNKFFSLTDSLAGAAGIAHGGPAGIPLAIGGAAANKALRTFGPAVGTRALDAAAKVARAIGPGAASAIDSAGGAASGPAASAGGEAAPAIRQVLQGSSRPVYSPGKIPASADTPAPTKGPDKWANDGIDNLKEHAGDDSEIDDMKGAMLADPKGKQLLIAASDLKPGSKAMSNLLAKIKERYGNATA